MPTYTAPVEDMLFLFEKLRDNKNYNELEKYNEVSSDLVKDILEEAAKINQNLILPLAKIGDESPAVLENGVVRTPPGYKEAYQKYIEDGWTSLSCDPKYGGQGMPKTVSAFFDEMLSSASLSFKLYSELSIGAYNCINHHAPEEIKEKYLPKIVEGKWSGTMCLTEPVCGTDLGLLKTKASQQADGTYKISGNPKGVVYHHRGAYLMSTGSSVAWNMPNRLNFLTIVPMFHCNGWCYPWTIPMLNGRTVCLRNIDVKKIFELIEKYNVTHFGGAPIILNMITGAPEADRKKLKNKVYVLTAGAPPPSIIFKKMKDLGFEVMHVYGLTETYGHVTQCAWNDEWNSFDEDRQNEIKARQGVRYPNTEGVTVMDPETMKEVPQDGKTIGEIMIRGNVVMKGYFKDKAATDKAMAGGWFHTGDLAVMHPDGYVKIQDRSKDIIISGGENISSIEIENTLAKHPSVSIAAVVAKPDEKWGEVPCAFIEMVQDKPVTENELIDFCKETLAGFKVPKKVIFCELPKTSTGKIQKFELRKQF